MKITQTKQTRQAYQHRCDQLVARHAKGMGIAVPDVQAMYFTNWLIGLKSTIKKSTFRQYKCSAVYGLSNSGIRLNGMAEALSKLEAEPQADCLKKSSKTSSPKAKCYPPDVLDRVVVELHKTDKPAKYAKPLLSFLLASIALGLRPNEWGSTFLSVDENTGEKSVILKNSKTTNGRGSGPKREILYGHMPDRVQTSIEYLVGYASSRENWADEQKKISDLHYRVQKRISPKGKRRYTLYSCRHQCSANMKMAYTKETIAEVMGHGSEETATTHYGRRSAGRLKISKHVDCTIQDMLPAPKGRGDEPAPTYKPKP